MREKFHHPTRLPRFHINVFLYSHLLSLNVCQLTRIFATTKNGPDMDIAVSLRILARVISPLGRSTPVSRKRSAYSNRQSLMVSASTVVKMICYFPQ